MIRAYSWAILLLVTGNPSTVNDALVNLKEGTGPRILTLTEPDINAWTKIAIQSKKRLGVRAVTVDFRPNRTIHSTALVNMDEVEVTGMGVSFFKFLLSGMQKFELTGKLAVEQGKARFDVEAATLNDYTIPTWLASQVVSYLSSRQGPKVDITEDFNLPYGIKDLRTSATTLTIRR